MPNASGLPTTGRVVFLVPDIHDLQTGGNVFNRRIVGELQPEVPVRVVRWAPEATRPAALDFSDADVIVVDSLLAQHPEALRAVREEHPAAALVVLVHYLRCIDPSVGGDDTAADERAALRGVDGAIATSRFVQRALSNEGLSPEQVRVVRPGLHERYRGALPPRLHAGPPRMLTVANLLPPKGLQRVVDVLSGLRSLPWTWTLVGDDGLDPEYAAGVHRRLRRAGLTDRVTRTGVVTPDVLRAAYARADLFVLPSRFETCSLSMREAMARGLPVAGYRVGGLPENIGDAAAGPLVPPGDTRALCAALRTLLTDPLMRRQCGREAWRRRHRFPTWTAAAEQFREALAVLRRQAEGDA